MKNRKSAILPLTLLTIVCLISFNLFADVLTRRFSLQLDMTADHLFTLSEEAGQILGRMGSPVTLTVLNTESEFPDLVSELLTRMQTASAGCLSVSYLDPYTHPQELSGWRQKGLDLKLNTLVVEGVGSADTVQLEDLFQTDEEGNLVQLRVEQQLIPRIHHAASPVSRSIQFVEGHDEEYPAALRDIMEGNGWKCSRLPLSVSNPEADLVVIAAPGMDYETYELDRLSDYLLEGGGLIVFLSPGSSAFPNLSAFLKEWGVGITDSVVSESRQYVDGNPMQIVPVYAQHEICSVFSRVRIYPVLSQTTALQQLFSKNGNTRVEKVLYSSDRAEADGAGQPPFVLALAATREQGDSRARVFVCGSAGIYSESLLNTPSYANGTFISQAAAWCLNISQEDAVSIPPRSVDVPAIAVTAGEQSFFGILFIAVLPACLLVIGSLVVIRRRRL